MNKDSEPLVGLGVDDLEALADMMLAPSAQARLDELLVRNKETRLSPDEEAELDHLLLRIDQLSVLKARARFTLAKEKTETAGA